MEVTLSIMDRISLPSILKEQADYKTLIVNRDIKKKIELSQDELSEINYRTSPPDVSGKQFAIWNEKDVKVQFTDMEVIEIKESLIKIESEKRLTNETLHLYELFCL